MLRRSQDHVGVADRGGMLDAEVVLPVRWGEVAAGVEQDFTAHLEAISRLADVTVVDGSVGVPAERRRARWARSARVLAPDGGWGHGNGKVVGAMTGIAAARHERVVVVDDDVRYDRATLSALVEALDEADLVLPQNHPTSFPWWAWWECGRTLLNRAFGRDWPGTCAVRRSTILTAGGWSSNALYENLELARTVAAVGGVVVHRPDLLVARRPPTARHFLGQRLRQAYEDQAQPLRLALALAVLPAIGLLRRQPRSLALGAALVVVVAEVGRQRQGGARAFPPHTPLAAPLWLLERGLCSWVGLGLRALGGPRYHGRRYPLPAHSRRWLVRHLEGGRRS